MEVDFFGEQRYTFEYAFHEINIYLFVKEKGTYFNFFFFTFVFGLIILIFLNTGKMEDFQAWLKKIKTGNKQAINILYDEYRPVFVKWLIQQYRCGEEEAVDIFQDSVIALYKNAQRGKLDVLKSGVRTYLFAIGKNIYLNRLRSQKETVSEDALSAMQTQEEGAERRLQMNDRKKLIAQLLNKMKDPCKSILYLFYYRRYSIEAIQKAMKYNTVEVVRTQKRRCIKSLEKRIAQVIKRGEI